MDQRDMTTGEAEAWRAAREHAAVICDALEADCLKRAEASPSSRPFWTAAASSANHAGQRIRAMEPPTP